MQVELVDDVPTAFATLLVNRTPGSIALSGGSTARAGYVAAARLAHDWSATEFWFGDERCVPVGDADSNEGMARSAWLDRTETGAVHSLATAGSDPETAAARYEQNLRAAPPLDVVHLGLGPDGHTASLFPDSPALAEARRWVVATGDDRHPHPRLTLTFPGLAAARLIVVTVAGAEKRDAFERVGAGDPDLPAARLVVDPVLAAKTRWLVDAAAAGRSGIPG
jgi:6-phosphogluconolactonase